MSDAKDNMEQIIDCESLDYKSEKLLEKVLCEKSTISLTYCLQESVLFMLCIILYS